MIEDLVPRVRNALAVSSSYDSEEIPAIIRGAVGRLLRDYNFPKSVQRAYLGSGRRALVSSDFKNGLYSLDGVSASVEDLWEYGSFGYDAALDIVPGVGLTQTATGVASVQRGPVPTAAAKAAMGNSFIVVMDYELTTTDNAVASPGVALDYTDYSVWGHGFDWYDNLTPEVDLSVLEPFFYTTGAKVTQASGHSGTHRVAMLVTPTQVWATRDGAAMLTTTLDPPMGAEFLLSPSVITVNTGAGTSTATITNINIYEAKSSDLLIDIGNDVTLDASEDVALALDDYRFELPRGFKREFQLRFYDPSDGTWSEPLTKREGFVLPPASSTTTGFYWLEGTKLCIDYPIDTDGVNKQLVLFYQSKSAVDNTDWMIDDFEDAVFYLSVMRGALDFRKPEVAKEYAALWADEQNSLAIYLNELEWNGVVMMQRERIVAPLDRYPVG